ncbi:MAG: CBU_0592 family membrane protein [Salibacteraceae bacterium]
MEIFFQAIGWIGAIGLLLAFYLNSTNKMSHSSMVYQLINLSCAVLLAINAFHIDSYPFIVINVFWAGVALWSILKSK